MASQPELSVDSAALHSPATDQRLLSHNALVRCCSAHRGATASACNSSLTAADIPFTSLRGCEPKPPPCSPCFTGGGIRYFSGSTNWLCAGCAALPFCTPQRIQSSQDKSTPAAAADSGWNMSETSTQAQTLAACVIPATKESTKEVRPEDSGPTISVIAPTGSPPSSNSSISTTPVATTGRMTLGAGLRADGIQSAKAALIRARRAEADIGVFALSSPILLASCQLAFCTVSGADSCKSLVLRS